MPRPTHTPPFVVLGDDHRRAVHVGEHETPRRRELRVAAEVPGVAERSGEPIRHAHARVRAHQLAQPVPVAPVESFDVLHEHRRDVR